MACCQLRTTHIPEPAAPPPPTLPSVTQCQFPVITNSCVAVSTVTTVTAFSLRAPQTLPIQLGLLLSPFPLRGSHFVLFPNKSLV